MKAWSSPYHRAVADYRRALLTEALLAERGNRTRAAARLGLGRRYLCKLIREFGIAIPAPAEAMEEMV